MSNAAPIISAASRCPIVPRGPSRVKPLSTRFLLAYSQNLLDSRAALRYRLRMDDALRDLAAENALLRGHLYLTAQRLHDYQQAPHFEIDDDGRPMLEVIVPPSLREQSAEALTRAQKMLQTEPTPAVNDASVHLSQARPDVTSDLIGTLDSVRATLKLRHMDEASDDDVAKALQMADESLVNARGAGRAR